jgi:TPR repeat protein
MTAKLWYTAAAYTGNANAQNNLAGFYAEGLGGEQDDALAAKWYQKAANSGVPSAQFNLGNFYEEGRGVPRDIRKAVQLLESAGQRDAVAAFNAGNIYATGRDDFPKDMAKAVAWYEKSAAMGYASAQYNLATIYVQGTGVTRNYPRGRELLLQAAQQNHPKAQVDYGLLLMVGAGGKQEMAEGRQWVKRGATDPATLALVNEHIATVCRENPLIC